mgnify:CR=1 FL=1
MKQVFTDLDIYYMKEALKEAKLAEQHGDVPVGAVVVLDGQIIGRGHNRREVDSDPTAHAEILALRAAGSQRKNWRLNNALLYVTLEPCPMCASAIVQARIRQVIYGVDDPRLGAAGSLLNLLQFPGFFHDTSVRSGLLLEECQALLQDFFKDRRDS